MSDFLKYVQSDEPIIQPLKEAAKRLEKAFIDVDAKIEFPPVAISIGSHQVKGNTYPTAFATYGNFSALMAASKARKTFFKSLLVASFVSSNTNNFTKSILGHKKKEGFILDFDTEQSRFHAQNVFKRIKEMTGSKRENYKPFAMREFSVSERIETIEYALYESEYKDNIQFVIIDGIGDLVRDVNDIKEATFIVEKLMRWTSDKNCHILNIIHTNPGTNKPKGHLGTFIMQKAETIAQLEYVNERESNISFPYTRNYPIESLVMGVDDNHLPYIVGERSTETMIEFGGEQKLLPNTSFDANGNPF